MSTRDHHVAGQPPQFSRYAQEFKHLDGRRPDWRKAKPGLEAHRSRAALKKHGRKVRQAIRRDPLTKPVLLLIGVAALALVLAHAWKALP